VSTEFRCRLIRVASTAGSGGSARERADQVASGTSRLLDIEDQIFTDRRLRLYGAGVAVAYAFSLVWRLIHGQWIILSDGRLRCVDFGWMWLSGIFASSGAVSKIYDYSTFSAAQLALFGQKNCPFFPEFDYPPTSLFVTYSLGWMPYLVAFAIWNVATLLLYLLAVYTIIPRWAAVVAATAPFYVAVNADFGHNGFLTSALVGFAIVALERNPWPSGIFLGLLTYKPQFGVLFPIALFAARNWRAIGSATAASVAFGVLAGAAFGFQRWLSFFEALLNRHVTLSPDAEVPLALHSVFGLLRWAETSAPIAWGGHLIVAAIVALTVWLVWAKPIPFSLKAAVLCIGSAMVSPYILFYDLCILSIAVAFLVRDGLSRGFLAGERTVILVCFAALFLVQVPIGPVVCIALFILASRRIVVSQQLDQSRCACGV
jgi:hypothetical protein